MTGWWILRRQRSLHKELKRKQSLSLLDKEGFILNAVQVIHTHFECPLPSRANLATGYRSCWVPGDIMSYSFNDLYSQELDKGELQSIILVHEFEPITMIGVMCDYEFFFSARFHGIKGEVKHYSS